MKFSAGFTIALIGSVAASPTLIRHKDSTAPQVVAPAHARRDLLGMFPSCASQALMPAIKASGCDLGDSHCLCTDKNIVKAAKTRVLGACGFNKAMQLIPIVNEVCGSSF